MGTRTIMPEVETASASVPAALAPHMDKIPPPAKEVIEKFFGDVANPQEASARGFAAAMTVLQLWAASDWPIFCILVALVTLIDPMRAGSYLVIADTHIHKALSSVPAMFLLPGAIGAIVLLNILGYMIYMLSWIICLFYMALSAHFAAEVVVSNWKKEQKHAEGEEPPLVSPGGSLHAD